MEYQNETLSMIYYRSKSFHQNVDNKPMKIILDCKNIQKAKYVPRYFPYVVRNWILLWGSTMQTVDWLGMEFYS